MTNWWHDWFYPIRQGFHRRRLLRGIPATACGLIGLKEWLAIHATEMRRQHRAFILLWMQGGPSQLETFDPKPGTENGGETEVIATTLSGVHIAAPWEKTAQIMNDLAIVRSLTNKEAQHDRATYQLHTGYIPSGSIKHPALSSNIARELAPPDSDLPAVVTIGGRLQGTMGTGAGFLEIQYEPFRVTDAQRLPDNLSLAVTASRHQRRLGLLDRLEDGFAQRGGSQVVLNHRKIYRQATDLVLSPRLKAFDLREEPEAVRQRYGDTPFGRGCLLARRLVEAGVTCIEVQHGNWDTHQDNFKQSAELSRAVDPALAALITDLKERGLLDTTLVVWLGEFGRTPRINPRGGRDHFPRVFSTVLAGGGIRGGQVIGASTPDGMAIADRPITVPDLMKTICLAMQVDPTKENMSPLGRPIKIVDGGEPIRELVG
ncbi:MAG: hypothetical protein KatS3mg113_0419 [Planctomycetaceae bacterium]|nr:MAG: hypothetical protein KatS3mg113_0419 [Planctomycetaceae bacterium]